MKARFPIVFEREDNGAVSAYVPGLPVYAAADTVGKATTAIRSALAAHLRVLVDLGQPLPEPTASVKVASVSAGARAKPSVTVVGIGALLASRSSRAKATASRMNGRLGGRPRGSQRARRASR
jgi:predicted RNase H-like HicB family nuclease